MNKYKEIKVGILAVVAAAVLYFGFNYLKGMNIFSPDKTYVVEYNNINGLLPSDRIIINGFQVGQVGSISLDTANFERIFVVLAVNREITLKEGTIARLVQTDVLGSKAIELIMSRNGMILNNQDTLIAEIDKGITELLTEGGLSAANSLTSTVNKINAVLQPFVDGADDIRASLANIKDITSKWKDLSDQMSGTIEQLELRAEYVSDSIASALGSITAAANSFKSLGDSLKTIDINSRLETMDKTLLSFNEVLDKIKTGEGTLGQLVTNDSLYHSLNSMMTNLDSLFIDMENNPKRYVHFSLFGRRDKRLKEKKKNN